MGLRQALMALMEWATNVPQKLLQCDAIYFFLGYMELITKKSYNQIIA